LQGARSLRAEGNLAKAERCALDAMVAGQEPGGNVSQAVALIHLADIQRDTGKLGPSLTSCQKAYRIFQRQASRYQRHNEAVSAYALGLTHQLLGSEMEALKWYQTADQLFERVKEDWATVNALTHIEDCARIQHWMKTLSDHLTAVRTRPDANFATRIWVPIIPPGVGGNGFAIAELEINEYTIGRRTMVDGESFRVQSLRGTRSISLMPGLDYYALKVPESAHRPLGASEGDYALVVRKKSPDREGPGVLDGLSGPEFGNFKRDESGTINFVRANAEVIGGEDIGEDLQVGYVTALLKPT
jgi:hypothetical protein